MSDAATRPRMVETKDDAAARTLPRLTPAQRKALMWLPEYGASRWWEGKNSWPGSPRSRAALRALVYSGFANETEISRAESLFCLTPLGMEARKIIEQEGKQ